ncbi:MAG: SDR family NAD(P)-dependent oxidoreductase [Candidatus Sericytochromatia bacterium]|nr:SDR family NAD(P)-dependent oxidoreductase [Candidatus Sericytochromatia bacterium]
MSAPGSGAVVILGATSAIARATAMALARAGHPLRLGGRDDLEVAAVAADIRIRTGVEVRTFRWDAGEPATLDNMAQALEGEIAGVLVAVGSLPEQREAEANPELARRTFEANLSGPALACEVAATALLAQGRGWLCGVGSVAGDRGRQSNYLYGAAKGGFHVYMQGLRHRLAPHGIRVTLVKPGFVDTAMTHGRPGLFLVASPQAAAEGILRAVSRGRAEAYVPGFWRWLMAVIRAIPGPIFERTRL